MGVSPGALLLKSPQSPHPANTWSQLTKEGGAVPGPPGAAPQAGEAALPQGPVDRTPKKSASSPQKDRASDGPDFRGACPPRSASTSVNWSPHPGGRTERGPDARSHTAQGPRLQPSAGRGRALPSGGLCSWVTCHLSGSATQMRKSNRTHPWEARVKIPGDGVRRPRGLRAWQRPTPAPPAARSPPSTATTFPFGSSALLRGSGFCSQLPSSPRAGPLRTAD